MLTAKIAPLHVYTQNRTDLVTAFIHRFHRNFQYWFQIIGMFIFIGSGVFHCTRQTRPIHPGKGASDKIANNKTKTIQKMKIVACISSG